MRWPLLSLPLALVGIAGCSLVRTPIVPGVDAGTDAADAPGRDAPFDARDVPTDLGMIDAPDAPFDAPELDAPELDGGPDAPPACVEVCRGDTLVTCPGEVPMPCPLGCVDPISPRCAELVPANVSGVWEASRSLGAISVTMDESIDTTACIWGTAREGTLVATDGGGRACLFVVDELTVSAEVVGAGDNPLIIVSRGDITIAGTVRVDSETGVRVGAGANTGGAPGEDGTDGSDFDDGGGGGGGFGGAGGAGGDGQTAGGGAGGGTVPSSLIPLVGGARGGNGPASTPTTDRGGDGGGAVQLTAMGTLTVAGLISAGGGAGLGAPNTFDRGAGSGGGSGGGILLEGVVVSLSSATLNVGGGGGGGGACFSPGTTGGGGEDSIDAATGRASGGSSCTDGGPGGDGAGAGAGDGAGGGSPVGADNGGGGGGGAGRILVRAATMPSLPGGATFNPTSTAIRERGVVDRR